MKSVRNQTLVQFAVLGLLVLALWVGGAQAQQPSPTTQGDFTLPFETRWGKAVLPAGDYSFSVHQVSDSTALVTVRGKKANAVVMTAAVDACQECGTSALIVLRQGGQRTVQALRLRSLRMTLYYAPPGRVNELLAQTPKTLERVPVLVAAH